MDEAHPSSNSSCIIHPDLAGANSCKEWKQKSKVGLFTVNVSGESLVLNKNLPSIKQ